MVWTLRSATLPPCASACLLTSAAWGLCLFMARISRQRWSQTEGCVSIKGDLAGVKRAGLARSQVPGVCPSIFGRIEGVEVVLPLPARSPERCCQACYNM